MVVTAWLDGVGGLNAPRNPLHQTLL